MYYVDDSGIPAAGLALYAAVGVPVDQAAAFEQDWASLREGWLLRHAVPVHYELHSTLFINGRGRPGGRNPARTDRYHMAQEALDLIGSRPGVIVTAVHTTLPGDWRAAKVLAYEALLRRLDHELAERGEYGEVVVDGDGTESLYADVHGVVRPRRIAEPAVEVPAHMAPKVQAADLVAYTACQAVVRQERRRFMWHWFAQHLPKAVLSPRPAVPGRAGKA
ncbi:DUF3800 domain-containing protein [Streptomyces sp. NPDC015127]|uniref:DUF3800 domain-containing protein n=1 Tax=Streptomyces sp. NPDC015127 TaxID=3364939 RepID=UPI0037016DFD